MPKPQKAPAGSGSGTRRDWLCATAAVAAGSFWADRRLEGAVQNINRNSRPSSLKITDLRVVQLTRAPMNCVLVRIDTNQGISGIGEQRPNSTPTEALRLKRVVLGENPCNVEKIFRKIREFAHNGRNAGGVSGIETALWDLAGKAYGVPVYQMLGGKYRDRIRCYADTPSTSDPKKFAARLKQRIDAGFTWLKMDLGVPLLAGIPNTITRPLGQTDRDIQLTEHMFTGMELTPKGIGILADYVAQVRDLVGMEIPISADHFGHIGVKSCIKLGKALEKYNLAWLEDMIPWQHTMLLKQIRESVDLPVCTGEDIYLAKNFEPLAAQHAIDIAHPDLAAAGGILETKHIGDLCQGYGIPTALHFAGTPVFGMASVHCAAATEGFLVMEYHAAEVPWWGDLVTGVDKPIVKQGFITVPEGPGLGITLNEDVIKQHIQKGTGYFEPTPQWDNIKSVDRPWA